LAFFLFLISCILVWNTGGNNPIKIFSSLSLFRLQKINRVECSGGRTIWRPPRGHLARTGDFWGIFIFRFPHTHTASSSPGGPSKSAPVTPGPRRLFVDPAGRKWAKREMLLIGAHLREPKQCLRKIAARRAREKDNKAQKTTRVWCHRLCFFHSLEVRAINSPSQQMHLRVQLQMRHYKISSKTRIKWHIFLHVQGKKWSRNYPFFSYKN